MRFTKDEEHIHLLQCENVLWEIIGEIEGDVRLCGVNEVDFIIWRESGNLLAQLRHLASYVFGKL